MAKKDRMGTRIKREQKKPFKMTAMEYYLIVTDTEATELILSRTVDKFLTRE